MNDRITKLEKMSNGMHVKAYRIDGKPFIEIVADSTKNRVVIKLPANEAENLYNTLRDALESLKTSGDVQE